MKLLLMLNENPPGAHDDVHRALESLKKDGILKSFCIYPFLARISEGLSHKDIVKEITELSLDFQPTGILWSHTGNLSIHENDFKFFKELASKPSIGYWDGDIYQKFYKPLPKAIINLARMCDVSFWQGFCGMIQDLKKAGCHDIRYVPPSTDRYRFSRLRQTSIKYDVVMVGNNVKSVIPLKTFPGSIERKKIANFFYKKLGSRFAVFGNNWKEKYSKGPIPFKEQNDVYHSSRISIGLNNLHAKYYFSNRLPISLSSGVIMVHNYEPGLEEIFADIDYPYFFRNVNQAWEIVEGLLAKPQEELNQIANKYRDFALQKLTMTQTLKYMIQVLYNYHVSRDCKEKLNPVQNPWINSLQF